MFGHVKAKKTFQHVVGEGLKIEGTITFTGALLVGGLVIGDIDGKKGAAVVVRGKVRGRVCADSVFVDGQIDGPIKTHTLVVRKGGVVIGNIEAAILHVEQGAKLNGMVNNPTCDETCEQITAETGS